MRSFLRSALHWLLLVTGLVIGIAIGIFALRSMVWAAVFAAVGALAAAVFLRTRAVRNVAVTLTTIFTCLLIGEGVIAYGQRGDRNGGTNGGPPVATSLAQFEPQPLFIADPALGWTLRPSSVIRAVRAHGAHVIYDATYTIGADGHRVTPASGADGETVLFLGDSFMFGDGLPDSQTLPQLFATRTNGRFHVVNLGVSAYGPNQVLRQLELGVVDRAVRGRVRAAFLYFNDDQLPRAAGDKEKQWWWQVAPQYELTTEGLRVVGTVADAWARRGPVERAVSQSVNTSVIAGTVRRFARVYPQLELSEAIVRQIRLTLRERHGVELVVIYWSGDRSKFFPTAISRMIDRAGARMLFIPDLMPPAGLSLQDALIPEDGHPTGRLNDLIAGKLASRFAP